MGVSAPVVESIRVPRNVIGIYIRHVGELRVQFGRQPRQRDGNYRENRAMTWSRSHVEPPKAWPDIWDLLPGFPAICRLAGVGRLGVLTDVQFGGRGARGSVSQPTVGVTARECRRHATLSVRGETAARSARGLRAGAPAIAVPYRWLTSLRSFASVFRPNPNSVARVNPSSSGATRWVEGGW